MSTGAHDRVSVSTGAHDRVSVSTGAHDRVRALELMIECEHWSS